VCPGFTEAISISLHAKHKGDNKVGDIGRLELEEQPLSIAIHRRLRSARYPAVDQVQQKSAYA
jgi:hypothetical protein